MKRSAIRRRTPLARSSSTLRRGVAMGRLVARGKASGLSVCERVS